MKIQMVSIGKDGLIRLAATGNITSGDFDASGINPLATVLGPNYAQMRVVLDMSQCTYIDSSAIGWLIKTQKELKAAGGQFVLHSVQPSVRQVLDLLKVGRVVPIVDGEDAATAVMAGGAQ
jgi:anti-anti-sigma factor